MAGSSLGEFAQGILDDLAQTANKGELSTRQQLNKVEGQILIINKKRFMQNLGELVPQIRQNQAVRDEIWEVFSTFAKQREKRINPSRLLVLKQIAAGIQKQATDYVFFVKTYGTASRLKSSTLRRAIKIVFQQKGKALTSEETENLGKIGGSDNRFGAQLGHAEMTKGGQVGLAASSVRMAAAKEKISTLGSASPKFTQAITKYEQQMNLTLHHEMVVKDGKIKKEYVPVLSWQTAISNQALKNVEAAALSAFRKDMQNIIDIEGSPTLREAITDTTLYDLASGVKRAKKKVTGTPKKSVKSRGRGKGQRKVKTSEQAQVVRDDGVSKDAVPALNSPQKGMIPLTAFIGPLNERISDVVRKNMIDPRLVNRTGRFANSVRVVDAVQTAQGYPSFGYTYQRSPYDKFETDPDRDPRKLIDKSMREIAAGFALGRFYTRRV